MAKRGRPKKVVNPDGTPVDRRDSPAKKWLQEIERAKRVKQNWLDAFRISLAYEYYEGRQRPPEISPDDWITVNLIYSTVEAQLPSLYSLDPYFYISLKSSYKPDPESIVAYEARGKIRAAMLNYLKAELDLKPKARVSIKDAMFQFGVMKVHYTADLEENEKNGEPIMGDDGLPELDTDGMPILQPEFIPANEAYSLSRIHPSDFLVDGDAGPLDDSVAWKAQRVKMRVEDAKKDNRFTKKVREALRPSECSDQAEKDREARKKGSTAIDKAVKEPDTVVMWEVYDLRNEQWFMVSEGCDDFLIDPSPIPEYIDGDPFCDLRFSLRDDSWYPIPPVSQLVDPQREYCQTRSKILAHRKRFNRKYEMWGPAFDDAEDEATKLTAGDDGTVLIKNQQATAVSPVQDAPLDMQVHTELAYLRGDFGELAVGANQRGSGSGVDSATEAGILEKRAIIREGDRVALVSDWVINIARKLDQCVQANITRDQAVRVTGPQGEYWESVRQQDYEEIEGEYEYTVDVGATTPHLPEIERAQLMSFLGTWIQAPQLFAAAPELTKKILESHHIQNEVIIAEIKAIGDMIAQGAIAGGPGATGSQPNTTGTPAAQTGGMAMGTNNIRGGA